MQDDGQQEKPFSYVYPQRPSSEKQCVYLLTLITTNFQTTFRLLFIKNNLHIVCLYHIQSQRISRDSRQLRVKDSPKVLTWRPERDSNLQTFGRKASNLPMINHAQMSSY